MKFISDFDEAEIAEKKMGGTPESGSLSTTDKKKEFIYYCYELLDEVKRDELRSEAERLISRARQYFLFDKMLSFLKEFVLNEINDEKRSETNRQDMLSDFEKIWASYTDYAEANSINYLGTFNTVCFQCVFLFEKFAIKKETPRGLNGITFARPMFLENDRYTDIYYFTETVIASTFDGFADQIGRSESETDNDAFVRNPTNIFMNGLYSFSISARYNLNNSYLEHYGYPADPPLELVPPAEQHYALFNIYNLTPSVMLNAHFIHNLWFFGVATDWGLTDGVWYSPVAYSLHDYNHLITEYCGSYVSIHGANGNSYRGFYILREFFKYCKTEHEGKNKNIKFFQLVLMIFMVIHEKANYVIYFFGDASNKESFKTNLLSLLSTPVSQYSDKNMVHYWMDKDDLQGLLPERVRKMTEQGVKEYLEECINLYADTYHEFFMKNLAPLSKGRRFKKSRNSMKKIKTRQKRRTNKNNKKRRSHKK